MPPASRPPDDDLDRDAFYAPPSGATPSDSAPSDTAPSDTEEDDYELEDFDTDIIDHERSRAEEDLRRARSQIQIDQLDDEAHNEPGIEDWLENFRWQFGVKHMLIATAALAVLMALAQLTDFGAAAFIMIFFALVGAHLFLAWRDNHRQEEIARRRRQLADQMQKHGEPTTMYDEVPDDELEQAYAEATARPPLKLNFSTRDMLITLSVSGVLLFALVNLGWGATASVLGAVALIGILFYAVGFEAPAILVLGWWVMLAMYVVVSIGAAVVGRG